MEIAATAQANTDTYMGNTLYRELKHIAQNQELGSNALNTTALINEAWLRMKPGIQGYHGEQHFYATASHIMRQVLQGYAPPNCQQKSPHTQSAEKPARWSPLKRTKLEDLLRINALLEQVEKTNVLGCRIMECRIFGGMTCYETAVALDISVSKVKREWGLLSAWMAEQLSAQPHGEAL